MKFNIPKPALFALLTAFGAGSTVHVTLGNSSMTQEQNATIEALHKDMRRITDIALYLISTLENSKAVYALDEIVIRMESTEFLMTDLLNKLNSALEKEDNQQANYHQSLRIKIDVVNELHSILKDLASILRTGMIAAVPKDKKSVSPLMFVAKVKGPLSHLSKPEKLDALEKQLNEIHALLIQANVKDASMIEELIELLCRMRLLTSSGKGIAGYCDIGKKLPKRRAPFTGIPQDLKLEDWIGEMHSGS